MHRHHPQISALTTPQRGQVDSRHLTVTAHQQQGGIRLGNVHGQAAHQFFPWKETHSHRPLGQTSHFGQHGIIHRQPQQTTHAADQHQVAVFTADHRRAKAHAFLQLHHARGSAGKIQNFRQGKPLEASITAEQAQAELFAIPRWELCDGDQGITIKSTGQKLLQGSRLLSGEFPTDQSDSTTGAHPEKPR